MSIVKKIMYASAVALLLVAAVSAIPHKTNALLMTPFGGRAESATYCTCTDGCWMVDVGDPRGGTFMYCPETTLYTYYNIFPDAWQLGTADGYMECLQDAGYYCYSDGGGPIMYQDGTSLY
jgi:hypothetical protein